MKVITRLLLLAAVLGLSAPAFAAEPAAKTENPRIRLTTNLGVIELELDAKRAPLTVQNFLAYMERSYYNGTIFHRVIPGFMIQGGGFVPGMREKTKGIPLKNEADNGLKNLAGTIAMARTPDPHSAGAQFFINTVDNPNLDHRDKTDQGWGYCVFGKVTKGMDVVKKIESAATGNAGRFQDVPKQDVVIEKVELIKK